MPDEIEVIPEGQGRPRTHSQIDRPDTPGGSPIPKTVIEKVDLSSPSLGDIPGTSAHSKRKADAVPDEIRPASGRPDDAPQDYANDLSGATSSEIPVPTTVITKVDSIPSHGEVPGTEAYNIRKRDAKPDIVEKNGDVHSE